MNKPYLNQKFRFSCFLLLTSCFLLLPGIAETGRLKEVSTWDGISEQPLIGYGLVSGLQRTGDSRNSLYTRKAVHNLLRNMELFVPESRTMCAKNVASVIVTANLPSLCRKGTKVDIRVSSIGDAKSLEHGILLPTSLVGLNGKAYAVAQGPLIIDKERTVAGYILNGAIVESSTEPTIENHDTLSLILNHPDFTSAMRVQDVINGKFGATIANAIDGGRIEILIPDEYKGKVAGFIAAVEILEVTLGKEERINIDHITGGVTSGIDSKIQPVALNYKGLKIEVTAETTVRDFIDMINTMGVKPEDVIAVFKSLKSARAIEAEIVVL